MTSKQVQGLVLASAVAAGYAGAAVYSAWGMSSVAVADGYGPGDGLTRYVVAASSGDASPELLDGLEAVGGVVSAQRLSDGRALVATKGMAPQHLEAIAGIADADFSTTVTVAGTITDPYYPHYGYNLDNTGTNAYRAAATANSDADAPEGWDGGTGNGRIVAVVDTGYDSDHPELTGALWTNPDEACGSVDTDGNGKAGDCHGWNFATDSADVDNGSYGEHGTSVAGVVGGRMGNGLGTAGIAPDVTIMPLVIGSGGSVDVDLGAEAIRYAVDHGADVINASWGGTVTGATLANLRSAVAHAAAQGVLVVAAAGNDGADRDSSIMYPAGLPDTNIVTVGNSTAADGVSPSSAYGATSVDLFAPGDTVFTTWNDGGYRLVSGTSIAAPQVAAAYALYRAAWPDATAVELKQALLDDVDPVPAFAGKSVTGGRLSVGSLADGALGAVRYTFTSMNSASAGVITPGVTASGVDATGDYTVTVGLGMDAAGEVRAVSGQDISVGGTTLTTDDSGAAVFDLGTATSPADLSLSPTMDLENGRYVLTVQLHRDGQVLGRTFAAPLLVGPVATASITGGPGTGTGTVTSTSADTGAGSGGTDPGTGDSDSGTGSGGPGTGNGVPAPGTGGSASFPEVGPFGITSMSPTTVSSSGGTVVTITGTALPAAPKVLIGNSAAATVTRSSTTSLTFRTPARADGVYDVHVFARDGQESVLEDALGFVTDAGGGADAGGSGTDAGGGAGAGGSGPTADPVVSTGPGGQRLVRASSLAALGSIWSTECSTSCAGVAS